MDISKKDLLNETGISYGQLYRWKREGLIPEEWFVKKSSFTGQETYFPKEAILKRIATIQQLKDQYSLEELAKILTPEVSNRLFSEEDLEVFEEIQITVAACFMDYMEKDEFTFWEVVVMMALSECIVEFKLSEEEAHDLIRYVIPAMKSIQSIEHTLLLVQLADHYYTILVQTGSRYSIDERLRIVKEIQLQELSSDMKMKYKHKFQFTFDNEGGEK